MVSILMKNNDGFTACGGSLINDRYILTAAHCLQDQPAIVDIIAMLGAHDNRERQFAGSEQQLLELDSYLIHENYIPGSKFFFNDMALIKLKHPVPMSDKWNPICLPTFSDHSNLFVYGWGLQSSNKKLVDADVIHEVEIEELANSTCSEEFWGKVFDPQLRICAGMSKKTCKGDSGGPLSTRKNGHVYLVGIVSSGWNGCGVEGPLMPDLYERVTYHLKWIQEHTEDANWCSGLETPEFTRRESLNEVKS